MKYIATALLSCLVALVLCPWIQLGSSEVETAEQTTNDEIAARKPSETSCCNDLAESPSVTCCKTKADTSVRTELAKQRDTDQFMLMMQGMAGIGPEDSQWVRDKLFAGFVPAPMPCCGPPGSKNPEDEHQCCEQQSGALIAAAAEPQAFQALVRFEEQFEPMLGRNAKHDGDLAFRDLSIESTDAVSRPDVPRKDSDKAICVTVHTGTLTESEIAAIRETEANSSSGPRLRKYCVSAISVPIFYNRFGNQFAREAETGVDGLKDTDRKTHGKVDPESGNSGDSVFGAYDPNGMVYVLDSEMKRVRDGSGYFNGGHDPIYYGVGRDESLFLKDPRTGMYLKADGCFASDDSERVPVLTVEPLVLRANRGDTVVIEFTNRLDTEPGDPAGRANLIIEGATYEIGDEKYVGKNCPFPESQGSTADAAKLRYIIQIPDEESAEGTYYFHSQPVIDPQDRQQTIKVMREQASHGLFGALIVEPPNSEYLDSYCFAIEDGSEDGFGNYTVDEDSYQNIEAGWAAIIRNTETGECYREHVIFFHDDLDDVMKNEVTGTPRALSYRYEGFKELFAQDARTSKMNSGDRNGPFAVNDHSMAYSAYTYGDASTPHPRFYVGDPMRYRIVHSGMGEEFHVFHHHAHRWRFQPGVDPGNLTKPSKRGLPETPGHPDVTVPISTRLDSQTLGPGETFDVFMEGGAGGTQRTVGDSLLHCHIIDHVTHGMWTYARVYNTLQLPDRSWYPPLAPLPDRVADPKKKPLIAVDSVKLAEMVADPGAPDVKPVSGPLAGSDIANIPQQLIPYVESQLPPQGFPERDKTANTKDKRKMHRANQWDWETLITPSGRVLYLGERYDLGESGADSAEESYVKFGIGYPTAGEGIGAHRDEPNPIDADGPPIDRPRLLFNPRDGRLAFPHLLPHAGRRPPFAPRKRLKESDDPGHPPLLVQDKWKQGAAYLGKTIKATDPKGATGMPFGSGLAPEGAPIKRFDVVALQLPITYSTFNGHALPSGAFEEEQAADVTEILFKAGYGSENFWGPENVAKFRDGDTVEWQVVGDEHGLKIENWAEVEQFVDIVNIGRFNKETGRTPNVKASEGTHLLTLKIRNPPLDAKILFVCTVHSGMKGRLANEPPGIDSSGQIFVLADDAADIIAGRKPAEPLVLRANTGDIVEVRLRSALKDDPFENEAYSKVGIHTHLVQYDVQSSDGAVGGLNYETSIRPSLRWNETNGEFECISGRTDEAVHYRWWCDVELGTVYFHDHSLLKDSLPHGLFGATVVEPQGATYHDSISGLPLYREREESPPNQQVKLISGTTDVVAPGTGQGRGLTTADVRFSDGDSATGFREFVPLFQDSSRASGSPASVNLRSAPLRGSTESASTFRPYSDLRIFYQNGEPEFTGGKATLMSSTLYGHPPTPIWRAFPNDEARIRVEGGATNFIHSLTVHGHRWRLEQGNPASTERDFILAGVSEAFTLATTAAATPGDYLYGSTGSSDLLDRGLWGIWRIHDPEQSGESSNAEVRLAVFLKPGSMPDEVLVRAGTRFVTRNGAVYETPNEKTPNLKSLKEKHYDYFQFNVRSILSGDQFNVPFLAELALDPSTPIESTKPLEIERIVCLGTNKLGRSSLQALPKTVPATSSDASVNASPDISLLKPAPQPDIADADRVFNIAALQVQLPIRHGGQRSGATAPILAYVPIQPDAMLPASDTVTEGDLADEIVARTRAGHRKDREVRHKVAELREILQNRFSRDPNPLVIRVASPANGDAPMRVAVRLINLLPMREEVDAQFGPTVLRPFGRPYSPLTSMHISLAKYAAETNDGSAVGQNRHSLIPPGDRRDYLWDIDSEVGICALRDAADPDHSMNGLFGALIAEPPGTRFLDGNGNDRDAVLPGVHAMVHDLGLNTVFREYVLFLQDGFDAQPGGCAINYQSAGTQQNPDTPHLMAYAGEEVRVRQIHAAGTGNQVGNHSFFIGGRRWRIDDSDPRSNRISAISEAPLSAVNIRFIADPDLLPHPLPKTSDRLPGRRRTYFYGSRVADHLEFGEWGEFTVLSDSEDHRNTLVPLPRSNAARTGEGGE